MTGPLGPRTRAALDALDERLVAEQINLRLYVSSGIVAAYVFDPDEDPADFAAAADRGDEVLAAIGADVAQQHGLPPDWLHRLAPRPPSRMSRRRTAGRFRAMLGRVRRPTMRCP